jgi:threonine dehydrogenase-like Zn-dependent dehydrogenase
METLIIKPKDKAELNLFLELAKRLGARTTTVVDDADERLFQAMENNKNTPIASRKKVLDTLHQIIKE